jgi:hypothetical protein
MLPNQLACLFAKYLLQNFVQFLEQSRCAKVRPSLDGVDGGRNIDVECEWIIFTK